MARAFRTHAASMPVQSSRFIASAGLLAGTSALFAGAYTWSMQPVACDAGHWSRGPMPTPHTKEEAQSIVNLYELSFGTVCGLCAGIFIKKGLKLTAFFLGGAYVLLQFLASRSLVRINWNSIESVYDSAVRALAGPADVTYGHGQYALVRVWRRTVNFLTADFQQRATFIGGLALGLRLG